MVRLAHNKNLTEHKAIETAAAPQRAYVPLSQHVGKACNPEVKAGDDVLIGQRIASVEAKVYAPIHSPVSGKVVSIEDWPHPVLGRCKAIIIENDSSNRKVEMPARAPEDSHQLTAEEIRKIVFASGIVGQGGAAFPSHIKLDPPKPVDSLIINGAECEPYLTGDYRLMLERTENILRGIELIARCLGVKDVYIAIEDDKPQAVEKFKIKNAKFKIKVLRPEYPQGGEKQLIKSVLGREVPAGKLPLDAGACVHNVGTALAVYEAVYLGKPLYERVVTVTGSCLSSPKNLLARVGTPIKDLIDSCGPLKKEPAKIITGGPMMGIAQFSDNVPLIKSTTGILLLAEEEVKEVEELFCIRCGACVRECPAKLLPTSINLAAQKQLWQEAKLYGASDCIECGVCSYVCPSNINLVQSIRRAKWEVARL
ncbi:MAG: electron transport complex subunit RsxC [Candidatus Omnitrophota bacterium]